ncbi:hypothetical protein M409DRAFT_52257 [Zasmidium cellare ATCC 36951]|uniref:F-box domain-containing protein n=1 Tax=Zasmidium cellare ATCC 36951 TaxID=1080233 RepID=A0A6A6CRN9_ZASCE|nr:uncharacterized protein M409DRAFT_52257 [Zasmidium cellare ATCC 36951]KAF2169751.1 hypothetical protein M409DRAFT_52257 [Zasmidium cellare ATCC 36951]
MERTSQANIWRHTPAIAYKDAAKKEVKPFRLLDLPPELWSKIGKMVISDIPEYPMCLLWACRSLDYAAPILRTCRVLREELLPSFYEAGLKISCCTGIDLDGLKGLLGHMDENARRSMRGVRYTSYDHSMSEERLLWLRSRLGNIEFNLTDPYFEEWKMTPGLMSSVWADEEMRGRVMRVRTWTFKFL